jgi:hypothetical protein
MGPLTLEARAIALEKVLDIQTRAGVDLINAEEEARIRELIAARTFPQKWDRGRAARRRVARRVFQSGAVQPILFRDLVGPGGRQREEPDRPRPLPRPSLGDGIGGRPGNHEAGCFKVPSPTDPHIELSVIAATGEGWDHVSVSTPRRTPNWAEMEHIKRLFFEDGETAMQLHVPVQSHISCHPHCLHIWRPQNGSIPLPPSWMVA